MSDRLLKVLFVCTGNTCRSPMAAAIFNREASLANLSNRAAASSAGLAACPGDTASLHARKLLKAEGVTELEMHGATPVSAGLLEMSDLVIVMTLKQKLELVSRFPADEARVFLLKEFSGDTATGLDIMDPFCSGPEKYRQVLEEIRHSIKKVISKLKEGR